MAKKDVYKRQVTDVGFLFQNALDLCYRPRIGFFCGRTGVDTVSYTHLDWLESKLKQGEVIQKVVYELV